MNRIHKKVLALCCLHDLPVVEHGNTFTHVPCESQIVGNEKGAKAHLITQAAQEIQDAGSNRHIQHGCRLVGDYEHWLQNQRARDGDSLSLPSTQLMRVPLHKFLGRNQPHLLHDPRDHVLSLTIVPP